MSKLNNDENFKHVDYHTTDLHKTFARIRKQLAEAAAKKRAESEANSVEQLVKVHVLKGAQK